MSEGTVTLVLRVWTTLVVLGLTGLVAFSLLIGTEQEWGLRHRPFPVLLWPLGVLAVGVLYTWLIWRSGARALIVALLLTLCLVAVGALQLGLNP